MANDFSGDSNCKALWRFESGALTTDSKGTNTLTDNNTVGTNTTDYKEGAASADFEEVSIEYFSITDANLDTGFPLKSGDTNKKFSVCFWCRGESLPNYATLVTKYATNKRTLISLIDAADKFYFGIGYNTGIDREYTSKFGTAFTTGKWYHVAITFQDSDKSYRIRIWDDTAGALLGTDVTGTFTNNIFVDDADLVIGGLAGGAGQSWDGEIDEVVVFDDVLSTAEIDQIRAGTYGAGSDIDVPATLDALTLTEFPATVTADIDIDVTATLDALTLTEFPATVQIGSDITAVTTLAELTLTEYPAIVNVETEVSAGVVNLTLTEYPATVDLNETIDVSATLAALTLTEYPASITLIGDISVAATVDNLVLTTFGASIDKYVEPSATFYEDIAFNSVIDKTIVFNSPIDKEIKFNSLLSR